MEGKLQHKENQDRRDTKLNTYEAIKLDASQREAVDSYGSACAP